MRIIKKALKKAEAKEAEGIKFMNQYKYLALNLQNAGRLTTHIDSLKIKLKKMTKMIFLFFKKIPFSNDIQKLLLIILPSPFLVSYSSYEPK
jgi:hypothetical protein